MNKSPPPLAPPSRAAYNAQNYLFEKVYYSQVPDSLPCQSGSLTMEECTFEEREIGDLLHFHPQ